MQTKVLTQGSETTHVLVFETGDEVSAGLLNFAKDKQITAAHFTAIGAFKDVTLGWFNLETQDYEGIVINEQVEVLSCVGNVAVFENEPKVHAHLVVGKRDGTAHGGHLLRAHVRPTLELTLVESPRHLQRKTDPTTGLALLDPNAESEPHRRGRSVSAETE